MALRFDHDERTLTLSVRDLVERGPPSGHLVLDIPQRATSRMAAGREAHVDWQSARAEASQAFAAEVTVRASVAVAGWTVTVQGRVDGLEEQGGHTVVEELKTTALDAARLYATTVSDWPAHTTQLEVYLWVLDQLGYPAPLGRLVLLSLLDGSRHLLPVAYDTDRIDTFVRDRLARLVAAEARRRAWLAERRTRTVVWPFDDRREGQARITERVDHALSAGHPLLVAAPTGLGKTAAVLHGALAHALAHDKQVFWATSRNTQAEGVLATLARFREAGLRLSWVSLRAKAKVCLNEVVSCRPDACAHARDYYDTLARTDLVATLAAAGALTPDDAMEVGRTHQVCPFQLGLDVAEQVDVVVGDLNYVLSATGGLSRFFGPETAKDWVVVIDEAHQAVDRARSHHSPAVPAELARQAHDALEALGTEATEPFLEVCRTAIGLVLDVVDASPPPSDGDTGLAALTLGPWKALADQVDALAFDYAGLRLELDAEATGGDAFTELSRRVMRFADAVAGAGEESVALVDVAPGREAVRLLCLDPSPHTGPHLARLGGLVGCSATLQPFAFHRDLLGLPADTGFLEVPSPFPPERRAVMLAPRVSTMFKDRAAHAERTASLLGELVANTPGHTVLFFPSFSMLDDLAPRLPLHGRELLCQRPGMSEEERAAWLQRLGEPEPGVVLAAVLGGIFAEGIDPPPGALRAVAIVGPALPPIGLERDLLRRHFDERFGQGFLYASLVPGLTRVVQAAGRLVRRPEDRGVIVLVGKRFRWRDHASLLPEAWQPTIPDQLGAAVAAFWADDDGPAPAGGEA